MSNIISYNIFFMLGGIAVLMFGMKVMGNNLEQVAGNNMKKMLGKMTTNRFAGVGVGAIVTAIINSSTAVTVMIVGFVNIGLMNLLQATAVIMGANIGTTITAQILSLSGSGSGGFDVAAIASLLAAIGMVMTFIKSEKIKKIGNILLGIGLIFVGLKVMGLAVNGIIYEDGELTPLFTNIFSKDHFPLLLILIGIVLTALVHSSAAITGILIALGPAISFNNAVFIILGSNIGTCITSLVSSIGTTTNAKRTAVIHLLFNFIGCLICIAPIWIWGNEIASFMASISGTSREREIANFHTIFNCLTTLILLPFIKPLTIVAQKIIPEKKDVKLDKNALTYIDERLLETPAVAVGNVKYEILKMSSLAKENINIAMNMLLDPKYDEKELFVTNENALNFLNRGITAYLTKLMGKDLVRMDEKKVGSYYHVVSDMERVGDYAENIVEYSAKLREEGLEMSDDAKKELTEVLDAVNELFVVADEALDKRDTSLLERVDEIEEKIDNYDKNLEEYHIGRVKKGLCSAEVGSIYLQTVSNLERIGDHITNMAFSIKNYLK